MRTGNDTPQKMQYLLVVPALGAKTQDISMQSKARGDIRRFFCAMLGGATAHVGAMLTPAQPPN